MKTFKYLLLSLVLLIGPGLNEVSAADANTVQEKYLYTIAAKNGTFDGQTLTLTEVPYVIYFSDAPKRDVGNVSLSQFVTIWKESASDPSTESPNAILSIYSPEGDLSVVVELSDLSVSGDQVSFNVKVLKGSMPATFGYSSLFIDDMVIAEAPAMAMGTT